MADLDAQVRESQAQVSEAQAKIAELTSKIETARAKIKGGEDAMLDIENATLEDVHAHTEVMNANIAELIMGLDDITAAFSKDFDEQTPNCLALLLWIGHACQFAEEFL